MTQEERVALAEREKLLIRRFLKALVADPELDDRVRGRVATTFVRVWPEHFFLVEEFFHGSAVLVDDLPWDERTVIVPKPPWGANL